MTTEGENEVLSLELATKIAQRQVLRYAGYCYDQESGMYYLSARHYDPETRQFLSKDLSRNDGEQSAYGYCLGNPVVGTDPSGYKPAFETGSQETDAALMKDWAKKKARATSEAAQNRHRERLPEALAEMYKNESTGFSAGAIRWNVDVDAWLKPGDDTQGVLQTMNMTVFYMNYVKGKYGSDVAFSAWLEMVGSHGVWDFKRGVVDTLQAEALIEFRGQPISAQDVGNMTAAFSYRALDQNVSQKLLDMGGLAFSVIHNSDDYEKAILLEVEGMKATQDGWDLYDEVWGRRTPPALNVYPAWIPYDGFDPVH